MHQKHPPANVATARPAGWAEQASAWATRAAASRRRKRLMFDSAERSVQRAGLLAADRIQHTVMRSAPTRQNNTLTVKTGKTTLPEPERKSLPVLDALSGPWAANATTLATGNRSSSTTL